MKIKIISFCIITLILYLFFLGLKNNTQYETLNLEGTKIDDFELISFDNEKNINGSVIKKNNFTLINFWASWCNPCRLEHNFLMSLNQNTKIKIIGVNFKDNKNSALKFLSNLGNPYDLLAKDRDGKSSIKFGVYGIPESILINDDFIIIKKFIGPLNENDYKEILTILKTNE